MNIDLSRIIANRGLGALGANADVKNAKNSENSVKPLFSDSLTIQERENFQINDVNDVDMDEIEKDIVRDDKLGKLLSSHLDWQPPEMPKFI